MADFKFLKGNIDTIILNALYSSDKYGYEIVKEIKEKTDNKYEVKQPTLYAYLKRLETDGLILSYWGQESKGGRRRYYKLTEEGRKLCEEFTNEWEFHRTVLDSLVSDKKIELDEVENPSDENLFLGTKKAKKRLTIASTEEQDELNRKILELENSLKTEPELVEERKESTEGNTVFLTDTERYAEKTTIENIKEVETKEFETATESVVADITASPKDSPIAYDKNKDENTIFITGENPYQTSEQTVLNEKSSVEEGNTVFITDPEPKAANSTQTRSHSAEADETSGKYNQILQG